MAEEPPTKRSRRASDSQANASALAKVLELGIMELSFCAVDDLKSLRASCRQLKALVDKELDRRIEQAMEGLGSSDCIFNLKNEEGNMDNFTFSSFTMLVGWPQEFSTDDGLVSQAMECADPDQRYDFEEMEVSVTLDSENAEQHLRQENEINVQDYLQQNHDNEEEEAEWNIADLDWTVSIEKPHALTKKSARRVFQSLILSTLLHIDSRSHDDDDDDDNDESHDDNNKVKEANRAREFSWVLLCRSQPSYFRYSGLECFFNNNGETSGSGHKCLMFRTVDGREFSFCVAEGYNGYN